MQYTTNYNLITVEGTDVVNPLVQMNPNFTDIDSIMKANADATVARATCTKTGTNHAVTTTNSDAAMQRFTATGNWETGDTMTIDGVSVSVYLPDGTAPQTGCFVINSEVIIAINGSRVTLYAAPALSQSAADISYDNTLSGLSASDVQDALDELALMPKGMYALGIVTTDAGCTVTLTKGAKTVTCTEVSSGVYEGGIDEYGTWAVNNVTLGYTRNFTVDAVKIYNLSFIPDGRTVTPVNDVQTLLHCAGIFDKGYTVLSQLIADTASLYSVITNNNAIDYMVRSTSFASGICGNNTAMTYIGSDNYASDTLLDDATWCAAICNSTYFESVLNVKVPIMTSNTAPSGIASAESTLIEGGQDYSPYRAFNENTSNFWISNNTRNSWVAYEFTNDVKIYKTTMSSGRNDTPTAGTITMKADGVAVQSQNFSTANFTLGMIVTAGAAGRKFSMEYSNCTGGVAAYVAASAIQFYGRAVV